MAGGSKQPSLRQLEARIVDLEQRLRDAGTATTHKRSHVAPAPEDRDVARQVCGLPIVSERPLPTTITRERANLVRYVEKKWVNGTNLRYFLFKASPYSGDDYHFQLIREGFEIWRDVGIGVTFEETDDINTAEVRIGFLFGDGSWSYVGRDVIDIPKQRERTMNIGWDLRRDHRGVDVVVHEIGHTLGFPHAHQNPFSGIVWDEEEVYAYFSGPPNYWSKTQIEYNILRKLAKHEVEGSHWDPDSIMHYAFPAGLVNHPHQYRNGIAPEPGLSPMDIAEVRKFYPPHGGPSPTMLEPFRSEVLRLSPTEQRDFTIAPSESRTYEIRAFGEADILMVLFKKQGARLQYLDGGDDSGAEANASIVVWLEAGAEYVLKLRLYLQYGSTEAAIMVW